MEAENGRYRVHFSKSTRNSAGEAGTNRMRKTGAE